jgi:dipeptidyl aminopeptidase/acylaminoacyl peptidase
VPRGDYRRVAASLRTNRWARWSLVAVLALMAVAYIFISYIIASGVTVAERHQQDDNPSKYGVAYEEVRFRSRDDTVTLEGWYIPARSGAPTIIYVHGLNSQRTANGAVDLAAKLYYKGYGALLFDLRGQGLSEAARVSAGYFEQEDVLGAMDYLMSRGVAAERVGVLGFSMGAATALLAASQEPRIKAVVADSPFANASDRLSDETARRTTIPEYMAPVFLPLAKVFAKGLYDIRIGDVNPERAVRRLGYPILVIHGDADTRIPIEQGRRVHRAAPAGSEFWLAPGVDHVDAFTTYPDEYVRRVEAYFGERLGE